MMWLWRTLPNTFFTNLMRRGNILRNRWSCRTNKVAESSFRISRSQTTMTGRMGWMQGMCAVLGKKCGSVTTGTEHAGHWKKWPLSVSFTETQYLNEQVEAIKELGNHNAHCASCGPLDLAKQSHRFDKHHPDTVRTKPQAAFPQPQGWLSWLKRRVHAYLRLPSPFYKLWNNYLTSFL